MLQYPQIDPVAIALGPLKIHWYGLMYLVGFLAAWWLGRRRAHRLGLNADAVETLIFYCAMGVILGGRVGYALFYGFDKLADNPLWLLKIWDLHSNLNQIMTHFLLVQVDKAKLAIVFTYFFPLLYIIFLLIYYIFNVVEFENGYSDLAC